VVLKREIRVPGGGIAVPRYGAVVPDLPQGCRVRVNSVLLLSKIVVLCGGTRYPQN